MAAAMRAARRNIRPTSLLNTTQIAQRQHNRLGRFITTRIVNFAKGYPPALTPDGRVWLAWQLSTAVNHPKEFEIAGKFEIFTDKRGEYRFHLKAPNGEVIAGSEGCTTKASAENGIKSVQANAPGATVVDLTG